MFRVWTWEELIVKTLLSFLGQALFAVLAILGIGLLLFYMDMTDSPGILREIFQRVQGETTTYLEDLDLPDLANPAPADIQVTVVGRGEIEKTNLVPTQADPVFEAPALSPTSTPVPPMDPLVYQAEATIRLKRFVAALERWMATNDQLLFDSSRLQDAAWRDQVTADLAEIAAEGQQLANIGQPPEEYAGIDAWLVRAGLEAERMQAHYLQALETGSPGDFSSAGDSFDRIKKFLAQAAQGMLQAGWTFE